MLGENTRNLGVKNIKPILCTPTDPKLPAGAVDLILMVDVYHELSEPEASLKGFHKGLKPDGRLVLVEFRAEDPDVPIKPEHKMTVVQARKELEANGFVFKESLEFLPWQHVIIFEEEPELVQALPPRPRPRRSRPPRDVRGDRHPSACRTCQQTPPGSMRWISPGPRAKSGGRTTDLRHRRPRDRPHGQVLRLERPTSTASRSLTSNVIIWLRVPLQARRSSTGAGSTPQHAAEAGQAREPFARSAAGSAKIRWPSKNASGQGEVRARRHEWVERRRLDLHGTSLPDPLTVRRLGSARTGRSMPRLFMWPPCARDLIADDVERQVFEPLGTDARLAHVERLAGLEVGLAEPGLVVGTHARAIQIQGVVVLLRREGDVALAAGRCTSRG